MKPSLVNIETALWVSRLGSFSAVARKLHTTQPAISLRIKELESSLGIQLFERQGRKMETTLVGRAFISRIHPLLDSLNDLLEVTQQPSSLKGIVRIGTGDPPLSWLGPLIARIQDEHPDVTFEFQMGIAPRLLGELDAGKLDCLIVSGRIENQQVTSVPLGESTTRWLMGHDRWQRYGEPGQAPTLKALLNCGPIWLVPRSSHYHAGQTAILRKHGASLTRLNTCDNVRAIVDLVANNGGLGFIPQNLASGLIASGQLVEVSDKLPSLVSEYSLIYARGKRPLLVEKVCEIIVANSGFDRARNLPR
ncbi:MAG: LysR family transcriptional regulator [Alcaligenaceae bacterium]|nr:LysR family transcriptional regulator [Alcaligenaceae bacterium]